MKSQSGAAFLVRTSNGNSITPRPFREPEPITVRAWTDAVSVLTVALSTIAKTGDRDSASIAVAALARAAEAVPGIMKDPAIRATVAVAAIVAESAPKRSEGTDIAEVMRQLTEIRAVLGDAKTTRIPEPAPAPAPPPNPIDIDQFGRGPLPPPPLTIRELIARLETLAQRKTAARRRGDSANVRTVGTQMTKVRKRLRGMLAESYDPDDPHHRNAAQLLGLAECKALW